MNIKVSSTFPISHNQISMEKQSVPRTKQLETDSFNVSFGADKKKIPWYKRLFMSSYDAAKQATSDLFPTQPPTKFELSLAEGIRKHFVNLDVPAQNLSSIMQPNEIRNFITNPCLKEENYNSSPNNIATGIYLADLDYATNYSNGKENVFDILDKVAKHANKYHSEKDPFVFAIADRDSIEGVQHAVRIIGQNPDKFRNVKFVPAIKLSFAHEAPYSRTKYENSEMIIYGINPFDDDLVNFVKDLTKRRMEMVLRFIRDVNETYPDFAYNIIEFIEQNQLKFESDYTVSNLYWRVREYAETKGDTAMGGKEINQDEVLRDAEKIMNMLETIYRGSDKKGNPRYGSFLKNDSQFNEKINGIFSKYATKQGNNPGEIESTAENTLPNIVEALQKGSEENGAPTMAIASPIYLSHYFEKENATEFKEVVKFLQKLKEESKGMMVAFESLAPNYNIDGNLTREEINNFNKYIRANTTLHEVGGSFADKQQEPEERISGINA